MVGNLVTHNETSADCMCGKSTLNAYSMINISPAEKEQQFFSQIAFFSNTIYIILPTTNYKALPKNTGFNKDFKPTNNSHSSSHSPLFLDMLFQ